MIIDIENLQDLNKLAKLISLRISGDNVLLLNGPIGAGKTTLTKMIAQHLGVTTNVTSPSFTTMNIYNNQFTTLVHLDFYHIEKINNLEAYVEQFENNMVIIEWADNLMKKFPNIDKLFKNFIAIKFLNIKENARTIDINGRGYWYNNLTCDVTKANFKCIN